MKKGIRENYVFLSLEKRQLIFSWIVILPLYFGILKNWCIIPLTKLFFIDIAEAEWAPMVAMIRNIIILALLSILLRDYIRKSFEDVKEKSIIHTLKWLGRGMKYFLFACIVNGIVYVVANQIVGVELSEQSTYNQALVDSFRISHRGLAFLSNVLIAPIVEELVFRVILFQPLRRIHVLLAIGGSSLIFGGLHVYHEILIGDPMVLAYMATYVGTAMALAVLYEKRRNIILCILIHMLINFMSLI